MLQKQTMTRNTLFALGSGVIQKLMTLVYFIIVARTFGPEDQGRYSAAIAFATLFGVLIDLGLASALTRETATDLASVQENTNQMVILRLLLGGIVYCIIVGSAWVFHYPTLMIQLIAIAGIATFVDVLSSSLWSIIRGFQNLWYESWGGILAIGIMMSVGLISIFFHLPIHLLVVAVLLGSVSNCVYSFFVLTRRIHVTVRLQPDWQRIRRLVAIALPFAGAAFFSRIYTFSDTAIVVRIAGAHAAGYYSAGNKLILALNMIPAAISASLYPAMSALFAKQPERLGPLLIRATHYLLLIVTPIAVGTGLLAHDIVFVFYGDAYAPTARVLTILTPAIICGFLIFPPGALLAATHNQKKNTIIYGIAAFLNVALNLLFIPKFAERGAAMSASITYGVIFVLSMSLTFRYWKAQGMKFMLSIARIAFSSAGMAAALLYFHTPWLIWNILVGVGAYGCMLFVTRTITFKEILDILSHVKSPSHEKNTLGHN